MRLNMKDITVKDIVNICKGKLICGDENIVCKEFKKDTRTIKTGDVYVGIKGENFDGNTLYEKAFENGAEVCIVSDVEAKEYEGKTIIEVEDSLNALQKIAQYKRSLYNIPVIAVTGSVGKTSTKDIIASVMAQKYKVLKTEGNMNNHIGLPMTISKLEDHEAMVVEMGMDHAGEIRVLTNIAHPTMCVISNIGSSHIKNLGSRENILKAKLEILEGTKENAPIVINNDNDLLHNWIKTNNTTNKIITYGIENPSVVMAKDIECFEDRSIFTLEINNVGETFVRQTETCPKVEIPVGGKHFVYNALSAICVGLENNIEIEKIIEGIKKLELTKRRMEIIKSQNGVTIINDTYNANYESMKAGLEYLHSVKGNRKIAILGDMLNLGDYEKELHEKIGEEVLKSEVSVLITVGEASRNIVKRALKLDTISNMKIYECKTNEEAIRFAKEELKQGDIVLVKASNAMHFDEIVENIKV